MSGAFSTARKRSVTIILFVICGGLAVGAAAMGVDDNPPGILLAFLAATALILAFVHPWRTARKFLFLLLAAVMGSVLFITLSIVLDTLAQDPATSRATRDLIESPITNVINVSLLMLCPAALVVGTVGSVSMAIRGLRQQKTKP